MIIKQRNETAKYETILEKLNKTIKKNELLKTKRIEKISATLEAKRAGRVKESKVKGK